MLGVNTSKWNMHFQDDMHSVSFAKKTTQKHFCLPILPKESIFSWNIFLPGVLLLTHG